MDLTAVDFSYLTHSNTLLVITGSTIIFTLIFHALYYIVVPKFIHPYIPQIKENKSLHLSLAAKLTCFPHSLIVVVLYLTLFQNANNDLLTYKFEDKNIYSVTTNLQRSLFSFSCGYFIYDTIIGCVVYPYIVNGKPLYLYTFHHLLLIFAMTGGIVIVNSGFILIFATFWGECTVPLLYFPVLKAIFFDTEKFINHDPTLDFVICKMLYLILFVVIRFGITLYPVFQLFIQYPNTNWFWRYGSLSNVILSLVLLPSNLSSTYRITNKFMSRSQRKRINPIP